MRVGGEPMHSANHVVEAERVGVEHRAAARHGKSIAGEIDEIDVGGPQRDAVLQDAGTLVDERKDAAVDDLVVGDLARDEAFLLAVARDERIDRRIGDGVAASGFVAVPARAGLLSEASKLAYAIGDPRINDLRLLDVASLADVPAHVVSGQIAHAER